MRTLIITNCTNRKRVADVTTVCARELSTGSVKQVTHRWTRKLHGQLTPNRAKDTYCGRGFGEALRAAEILSAKFLVVSAGLGLVDAETFIPRYSATISPGNEDSVLQKLNNGTAHSWWVALNEASPFSTPLSTAKFDIVLVGLPQPYFALIQSELEALPSGEKKKLRLFLRTPASTFPSSLRPALMPYDGRLDSPLGPLPGTLGDFAQRALRHFAEFVLVGNEDMDSASHASVVETNLRPLGAPNRQAGQKASDEYISELIVANWEQAGGRSTLMLRLLRDTLHVACEQKRFQTLFYGVKAKRLAAASDDKH
ncbi:hypothetical protein ACHAC9_13055 [Massilia sp. CMS3.1]|uniref:hypothetical protein n=1 Tax=Massilia sp. CMS3.1 TaxID=3373083 RepID=UPI003EE582C6